MKSVYLIADTIISPLGFSTEANIAALRANQTAITRIENQQLHTKPFYGALVDNEKLMDIGTVMIQEIKQYTKLELMLLLSVLQLLKENPAIDLQQCGIIVATAKGSIDMLQQQHEKAYLNSLSKTIQSYFKLPKEPLIVSNACISGGLGIAVAKRMMQAGLYEDMIVIGGDLLTEFTLSGFLSFQAVSDAPCKPFCKNRTGISLGEAAAATWLSTRKQHDEQYSSIEITGDATANDANHISGPSRTGEGLYLSVTAALKEADVCSTQIDYISAHGTATPYNDEMEAIAFNRVGLQETPLNSLKGYYGHTLGASALLETIIAKYSLQHNEVYTSLGFETLGVSKSINVIKSYTKKPLQRILKTASGFGGCNVALVLEKKETS